MTNAEVFDKFHTEKWVIEQNICFLLQEYWEEVSKKSNGKLPSQMPLNPVTFTKAFMKRETIVDTGWAEKAVIDRIQSHPENIIDADFTEA